MLLQATGVLPAPGVGAARQAADQARAATDSLGSIDRRLTAVEAMTESLPNLRADVTATAARVTMAEQNATALAAKSDVAALRTDLTALRARLDQAPPSATPAEVSALATRLARLEATAAGTPVPVAPAATTPPTSEADARIASLAARLDAAEAAIAKLSAAPTSGPVVATNATNARTAAVSALRRAVDTGVPFAAELDMVAAFGSDPMISGLRPYAAEGIATRDTLRADFAKVGDAILVATQVNDESLFGRLVAGARSLVSVRPVGPIAGSDPVAIVSRMDAAVAQGDFATTLREREGLPAVGKEASAAWAARVNQRLTADALLGQPAPAAGTVNR
jgi:hypothetical protein